jgi:hypothetical protein
MLQQQGPTAPARLTRLVGVYDADGTLRGELTYWIGARLGRSHCALCDITHGVFRERTAWQACRTGLPIPFDTFHRDDQPADIRAALGGVVPAVAAETTAGVVMLIGPDELDACAGSTDRLIEMIEDRVHQADIQWPG